MNDQRAEIKRLKALIKEFGNTRFRINEELQGLHSKSEETVNDIMFYTPLL